MDSALASRKSSRQQVSGRRIWQLYIGCAFCGVLLVPLASSFYGVDSLESLLAGCLLSICLYPAARYFAYNESGLPTLAILSFAYGLQFGIPIFTREETILLAGSQESPLNSSDVVMALLMAIVGVVVLQIAFYALQANKLLKFVPVAELHLNKTKAICYCLAISLLLPLTLNLRDLIPEQFQTQLAPVLAVLQNQILVVIGILGWLIYSGQISKWFQFWLYGAVALSSLRGISDGMLEQAVIPIAVLFVIKWLYTRKFPVLSVTVALALMIFLSPVKSDFREEFWYGDRGGIENSSSVQKVVFWFEQAGQYWKETLNGNRDLTESTASVTGRTDLIHQLTHIYSLTPSTIPYQYGGTYSYFVIAVIPRVIWPEKPVAGSANNYFAVNYGITTEEGAERSTFGVSLLGEGFINFGWAGVLLIMALQGIIIGLLQHIFGGVRSGAGGQAVFLAFFIFFLNGIGSSAEILFGNILQNLLCGCLLLWWARSSQRSPQGLAALGLPRPALDR
jgi:hypothetical protein